MDRHIATVLAGIHNTHSSPPRQKEAVLPEDIIVMLKTLDRGTLRGLCDRAVPLIGFAGGLRRSEVVGRDATQDGSGCVKNPRQRPARHPARRDRLARG